MNKELLNQINIKNKNKKWLLYSDDVSKTVKAKMILNQKDIKAYYLDFTEKKDITEYKKLNSISLDENFKYKFRPDSTIRPE